MGQCSAVRQPRCATVSRRLIVESCDPLTCFVEVDSARPISRAAGYDQWNDRLTSRACVIFSHPSFGSTSSLAFWVMLSVDFTDLTPFVTINLEADSGSLSGIQQTQSYLDSTPEAANSALQATLTITLPVQAGATKSWQTMEVA